MISGILAIDKPAGWTSHDVVARVRWLTGQRQVGHAGTLDPLASGVLLLVLGSATRLSSYLMASSKVYCAEVVLGATTATDDAEAPLQTRADASHLPRAEVEHCLAQFIGEISQVPPVYAAVRQSGQKLYILARQGIAVEPEPRQVTIYRIELERWQAPALRIEVRCSPGTYIRSLARDIGATLGVGGYLHALRRVASGSFTLADCSTPAELSGPECVERCLLPLDGAVLHLPALVLSPAERRAIQAGRSIEGRGPDRREVRLYDASGTLIALARQVDGVIKPFRVFGGGPAADASRL